MVGRLIKGLIIAWILVQCNVDKIFIDILQPLTNQYEITTNHFYFVVGFIGLISGCISSDKNGGR